MDCGERAGPDGAPPPSADRDAIASGVPVPAPAIVAHVSSLARAVSSHVLRLWPEADAPGLVRAILRHALDHRELYLKLPLVRPSAPSFAVSLSNVSMQIAPAGWLEQRYLVSADDAGAPVAAWRWSV